MYSLELSKEVTLSNELNQSLIQDSEILTEERGIIRLVEAGIPINYILFSRTPQLQTIFNLQHLLITEEAAQQVLVLILGMELQNDTPNAKQQALSLVNKSIEYGANLDEAMLQTHFTPSKLEMLKEILLTPETANQYLHMALTSFSDTEEGDVLRTSLIKDAIDVGANINKIIPFTQSMQIRTFINNKELLTGYGRKPLTEEKMFELVLSATGQSNEKEEILLPLLDKLSLSTAKKLLPNIAIKNFFIAKTLIEKHALDLNNILKNLPVYEYIDVIEFEKFINFAIERGGNLNNILDKHLLLTLSESLIDSILENGLTAETVLNNLVFSRNTQDVSLMNYDNVQINSDKFTAFLNKWYSENIDAEENLIDENGVTLLHKFLISNKNEEARKLLEQLPELVMFADNDTRLPLDAAYVAGNIEGTALCIDFGTKNIVSENNCKSALELVADIPLTQVATTKYTVKHLDNLSIKKELVITIVGPESADLVDVDVVTTQVNSEKIPYIQIGDGRAILSLTAISNIIGKFMPLADDTSIKIILFMHGMLSDYYTDLTNDNHHVIMLDSSAYGIPTKNLFITLNDVFGSKKPLDISFVSCFGGAAIADVDYLPIGSRLVTFAKANTSVASDDICSLEYQVISEVPSENMLLDYLANLKYSNAIPGVAYSHGQRTFLDQHTKFIGQKLTAQQKQGVTSFLDEKVCKSDELCLDKVKLAIDKVENASNFSALRESEAINEQINIIKSQEAKEKNDPFDINTSCSRGFHLSEIAIDEDKMTDYPFATHAGLKSSYDALILRLTSSIDAVEPIFGMTMAVLYALDALEGGSNICSIVQNTCSNKIEDWL